MGLLFLSCLGVPGDEQKTYGFAALGGGICMGLALGIEVMKALKGNGAEGGEEEQEFEVEEGGRMRGDTRRLTTTDAMQGEGFKSFV